MGPPTPLRYGPKSQPRPHPVPASAPVDDHTTVIPPVRDFAGPDNRTTAGLRRPALRPGEDPVNAHRTTDSLRRPDRAGSGAYPVVPESRATSSGAHPVAPDDRADSSGGYPVVPDGRATVSGAYPVVPGSFSAFADQEAEIPGGATASGGFRTGADRAARSTSTGENPVTSTGANRAVAGSAGERRATSTGSNRAVGRSTSTGGFRISESRAASTGMNRAVGEATSTGEQRIATEGRSTATDGRSTVTGTHRAMGKLAGRRRVAKWPIFAGVFVVLLVLGLLAWGWANNVLNSRAEAQANACTDGNSTLTVVVTPSAQKPLSSAADRWNRANMVVHAHCVHVEVRAMPPQQVLDALTGKADVSTIGGFPAAWVPENSFWINQLVTAKPGIVGSPAESVASAASTDYQFLGLAGPTVDEVQTRAAQVFRDFLHEPAQQADFKAVGLSG